MATNKTTEKFYMTVDGEEVLITNAKMMEMAVAALEQVNADPAVIAKAQAHLATIKKPSAKSGAPTITQVKNAADAEYLLGILPADQSFTLDWVADKMKYINNTGGANKQKAYQVVKVLIASGKVVKVATKSSESAKYQLV